MKNIITAVGCFALGFFVISEAGAYPKQGSIEMHPGFYPSILGYILVVLGTVLLGGWLWRRNQEQTVVHSDIDWRRLVILVICLVSYGALMEPVGYLVTTALFMIIGIYLFKGSPKASVTAGIITAGILFCLFRYIFKAPLPEGILF